jgi:tetratricopeptide (TPR) repeat protein
MKRLVFALLLLGLVQIALPVRAQMLPVTTTSEEARAHFELGRHAAFHYDNVRAREHLDAAIAADSAFVLAYLHRGGMSSRLERGPYFEAARTHRGRVSEGEQRMVDAFHAFLWDGNIERAIEIFTGLAEEYADDPYLPTYLGLRHYRNLGQYDEAREQFQRALQRDPAFAQAHKWLGYVALDEKDYERAEAHFRRYLELAPDQARPYEALGQFYLRTGRPDEAAMQFERSFTVDPRFTPGRESLMELRIQQANQQFQQAFARQDAAALAGSYTPGALLMPAGGGVRNTTASIEAFWQELLDDGISAVHLETMDVFVGNVAYINTTTEVGRYRLTTKKDIVADEGSYIVVWAQTADGWKRYRHMWASHPQAGRRERQGEP